MNQTNINFMSEHACEDDIKSKKCLMILRDKKSSHATVLKNISHSKKTVYDTFSFSYIISARI